MPKLTVNDVEVEVPHSCSQSFGLEDGLGEAVTQEHESYDGRIPSPSLSPDHYCREERVSPLDPSLWAALSPGLKQAIASDMHITRDGVVVHPASMDPDLQQELWGSGLWCSEAE